MSSDGTSADLVDLDARVLVLRREQPAASAAVEQYVDRLARSGIARSDALRRALEAVGR